MKNQKKSAHANLFKNLLIIPMAAIAMIPCSAQTVATSATKISATSKDSITTVVSVKASTLAPGEHATSGIKESFEITDSTKPLYIIDGKPATEVEVKALKPESIKEINVLKDASATAVYGTRGANGVVIIILK